MNKNSVVHLIRFFFCLTGWLMVSYAKGASESDTLRMRNFVVKAYISLLNRKPDKTELQSATNRYQLFSNPENGKKELIKDLLRFPEFSKSLFDLFRYDYLQGTDPDEIENQIANHKLLLSIKTQEKFADIFQKELDGFMALQSAESDFHSGKINYRNFLRIFFENKFFDEINMGDHNYVVSTFNYLLFRNPTAYELEQGKLMVNNQAGVLFTVQGESKSDYLNIIFNSDAWKEGQVRFWFNKLLNRNPTHDELSNMTTLLPGNSPEMLIEQIILNPEFSGK